MKKTVVIGASPNATRYSYKAVRKLDKYGHNVVPLGIRKGNIDNFEIITDKPALTDIDTVTMYVGPQNQKNWIEYIYSLNPKRIIFNPGTENSDFINDARKKGIDVLTTCTLILLDSGGF